MKQIIVIFFLFVACLNGEDLLKNNSFLQPDSLYIYQFGIEGDMTRYYSMISINYHNNQGILYAYSLGSLNANYKKKYDQRTDLLRKGVLNKNDIDSIIKIFLENNIFEIENNQINPNCRTISTGDGSGTLSITIKKKNQIFNKTIRYPNPVTTERTLNKKFIDFYYQLKSLLIELSKNIEFQELIQLYDEPKLLNIKFKNLYFQSHGQLIIREMAYRSIREIDDINDVNNFKKEFFKREKNNDYLGHPVVDILRAFYKSNKQQYYTFLDSIIKSIKTGDLTYNNIFEYVRVINDKDKLRNEYMKKCLPIEVNNTNLKAACFLVTRKDYSGLQTLLEYLDRDDYGFISCVAGALKGTQKKELIPLLIKKYFSIKNSASLNTKKKVVILSKYIYVLNKLLGIKGKNRLCIRDYKKNFEKESRELEQYISKYLK